MPVLDPLLAHPPAEKDGAVVPQRIEIHQAGLEPLEDAADRLQLLEILVDAIGVTSDLLARGDQLLGLDQSARAPR